MTLKYEPATPCRDTTALREQIIQTCLTLRDTHGYFIGKWGNISVRVEEARMLVTPTRVPYDKLTAEDIVVVTLDGRFVDSKRLPTSEVELHRQLLLERDDLGAIIHSHPPYATSVACAHHRIPVIVDDMAEVIGGEIRCAKHVPAGRHKELAAAAREAIGKDSCAVLMSNHGLIAGGRDLDQAVEATQIAEKAAMAYIFSNLLGGAKPIPEALWREERHRYLHKYGTALDFAELLGDDEDEGRG